MSTLRRIYCFGNFSTHNQGCGRGVWAVWMCKR